MYRVAQISVRIVANKARIPQKFKAPEPLPLRLRHLKSELNWEFPRWVPKPLQSNLLRNLIQIVQRRSESFQPSVQLILISATLTHRHKHRVQSPYFRTRNCCSAFGKTEFSSCQVRSFKRQRSEQLFTACITQYQWSINSGLRASHKTQKAEPVECAANTLRTS